MIMRWVVVFALAASMAAQDVRWETVGAVEVATVGAGRSSGGAADRGRLVVLVLESHAARAEVEASLEPWRKEGVVAVGVLGDTVPPEVLDHVRLRSKVVAGKLFVAGSAQRVLPVVEAWPFQFRMAYLGDAPSPLSRGRCEAVGVDVASGESGPLEDFTQAVIAARPHSVAHLHFALDDFHDAAAVGDEDRYFGRFAPEGVFLGTDPGERWELEAFRAFAMPYFERPSAWIYVPGDRNIDVVRTGEGDAVAFFDEVVSNRHYGDCRGTGVMRLENDKWLVCQYSLSIPVPNDLARGLVAQIRAHAAGGLGQGVTVIAVRHAEKGDGRDPGLTDVGVARAERLAAMLGSLPVRAVISSPYERTRATAMPVAKAHDLEVTEIAARDLDAWAARIADVERGVVVVVGHSNTVPALLRRLGFDDAPAIDEAAFDHLFVGRLGAGLLDLRY